MYTSFWKLQGKFDHQCSVIQRVIFMGEESIQSTKELHFKLETSSVHSTKVSIFLTVSQLFQFKRFSLFHGNFIMENRKLH
jgi:hypothetical protein